MSRNWTALIALVTLPLVIGTPVLVAGCDTHEQQDEFADDASGPPANYTQTDEGGAEGDIDEDDWRTAPIYAGEISIGAAFPNPVSADGFVTIPVTVTAFNTVSAPLRLETPRDGRLFRLDQLDQAADPGAYVFTFSAGTFTSRGLHRVFIFDGLGELVSYGDILVD